MTSSLRSESKTTPKLMAWVQKALCTFFWFCLCRLPLRLVTTALFITAVWSLQRHLLTTAHTGESEEHSAEGRFRSLLQIQLMWEETLLLTVKHGGRWYQWCAAEPIQQLFTTAALMTKTNPTKLVSVKSGVPARQVIWRVITMLFFVILLYVFWGNDVLPCTITFDMLFEFIKMTHAKSLKCVRWHTESAESCVLFICRAVKTVHQLDHKHQEPEHQNDHITHRL